MKMRVRFYIEKRRGEDGKLMTSKRPIYMTVAFHGSRVLISTGKKVDLKWWDQSGQKVQETHPDAVVINGWLNHLKHTAGAVWKALDSLSEKPGAATFRREFDRLRPRFSGRFFEIMFQFMEEGSNRWSTNSYQKVRSFYNQLREFEEKSGYPLRFDTLDKVFLEEFRAYNETKGRSPVTIHKMINTLVWFLNWATSKGFNVYSDYRRFYKLLGNTETLSSRVPVYLEWDELMQLYNYSFKKPVEQRVKDIFCLMCFSGLRMSEVARLTRKDVGSDELVVRRRNAIVRKVPLNDMAKNILTGYRDRYYRDQLALPPVSMVTMNKYLRIIARELGFKRKVSDPKNRELVRELHEVVTAGTAVQTFIMNALRLDIPAELITAYTGVKNDRRIGQLQQEMAEKHIKKFNELNISQ